MNPLSLWCFAALLPLSLSSKVEQPKLPYTKEEYDDELNVCSRFAEILSSRLDLVDQVRKVYYYYVSGGDLEKPPAALGSAAFVQALADSKIPEKIIDLANEEIVLLSDACEAAWLKVGVAYPPLKERSRLVGEPTGTMRYYKRHYYNQEWFDNALTTANIFPRLVKIAGDGDCFYRSFLYGLFHFLSRDLARTKVRRELLIEQLDQEAETNTYANEVTKAGLNLIKSCLNHLPFFNFPRIVRILNDNPSSDAMVYALRCIVAARAKEDQYRGFISGRVDSFIKHRILKMTKWGDHVIVVCLANFFNVKLTVNDLPAGRREVASGDLSPEEQAEIELMYKGDHYDIFYLSSK